MTRSPIPIWLKVAYTAFMCVLVPYYWIEYGPTNFIYFCDIALFLTLITVWTEKPIFASMAGVGILLPQAFWQIDFIGQIVGIPISGMTDYMFDPQISLFGRGLSFFHFWLPILIVVLVAKLGYQRRALLYWTLTAWVAMLISYFLLPAPGDVLDFTNQPINVNYVYGTSDEVPQSTMSSAEWFALLMIGLPVIAYLPTHFVLNKLFANINRVDIQTRPDGHAAGRSRGLTS